MASRLLSLLLNLLVAVSLMGTGLHASAVAVATVDVDAAGAVAAKGWPGKVPGLPEQFAEPAGALPLPDPQDLPDRDSLIDPPELFEALRVLLPGIAARKADQGGYGNTPPKPFIEGLRRPPRAASPRA